MTDSEITDYIHSFMEQLYQVEVMIDIPLLSIESMKNLPESRLARAVHIISAFVLFFGQCKHLTDEEPAKTYLCGKVTSYIEIERKYCQMIFLADMVYQKAGLYGEFKYAVAKGNEWLNLWKQTLKDND